MTRLYFRRASAAAFQKQCSDHNALHANDSERDDCGKPVLFEEARLSEQLDRIGGKGSLGQSPSLKLPRIDHVDMRRLHVLDWLTIESVKREIGYCGPQRLERDDVPADNPIVDIGR